MRAAVMLAVSLSCAGCALDMAPADEEDPAVGEVLEAMSTFTQPIKFSSMTYSKRPFSVPNNGVVTVEAHARWDRPADCKVPTFKIELIKKGLLGTDIGQGARAYPTSGVKHTETWRGLSAGTYEFILSLPTDVYNCTLLGSMNVSIKP